MRFAPFALAVLIGAAAASPVLAQEGTRIIIRKPAPRSYLDPGPVVKPGSQSYLDYIGNIRTPFPSYGLDSTITGIRYPLPDRFYLPAY